MLANVDKQNGLIVNFVLVVIEVGVSYFVVPEFIRSLVMLEKGNLLGIESRAHVHCVRISTAHRRILHGEALHVSYKRMICLNGCG